MSLFLFVPGAVRYLALDVVMLTVDYRHNGVFGCMNIPNTGMRSLDLL